MNDTVPVPKETLDLFVDTLHEAKAKLSLLSTVSMDSFSNDASYGLYLFATNISDDLEGIEHAIVKLREEHSRE